MTAARLTALATLMILPALTAADAQSAARLFLHPNGCVYTQSAAQGSRPMWHYVINGHVFFSNAHARSGCPVVVEPVPGAPSVG